MCSRLLKSGWSLVHVRGSHHVFKKDGKKTSVPVHGNELLKIGTLFGILSDIGVTPNEFVEGLKKKKRKKTYVG